MNEIREGKLVKFSKDIIEFCQDFNVNIVEEEDMLSSFLVIQVLEDDLEVEVLSPKGNVLRLGMNDLIEVEEYEV